MGSALHVSRAVAPNRWHLRSCRRALLAAGRVSGILCSVGSTFADSTAGRILDANLNRAREALRVLEEYARFGLDDAGLAGALKELRHELVGCVPVSVGLQLVNRRDIVGDVGRTLAAQGEYQRAELVDVVRAAAHRLSEALRTLEEYAKTFDSKLAAVFETMRYRGYELERRLILHATAREHFGRVRLYVLLTAALCWHDWLETAEAVLRGGADCLQLREKELEAKELLARAGRLAELCREHGALLIVNDRPDVAAASGADGVHLGQDDLPVAAARRVLPAGAVVGVSTHNRAQLEAAAAQAPDYVAVGPMFASPTKPQDVIAGLETLAAARQVTSLPLVAIGGITCGNAGQVLAAAPCCLCVCAAIIGQDDPEAATRALRNALEQSGGGRDARV